MPSRNILQLAIFSIGIAILTACTQSPKPQIILTIDDAFYPYMYQEEGVPKGLYTEIVKRVSEQIEVFDTKIVAKRWNEALSNTEKGASQGLVGTYRLPKKRPWLTEYSTPIFEEEIVFVCAAKHRGKAFKKFPDDFANMLIVNIADFDGWLNYNPRSAEFTKIVNFFEAPNIETAFKMTASGNVDCAVFERMSYSYMVNKFTTTAKDSAAMPYIAMSFKKENAFVGFNTKAGDEGLIREYKTRFNAALQSMRENGELNDLVPN